MNEIDLRTFDNAVMASPDPIRAELLSIMKDIVFYHGVGCTDKKWGELMDEAVIAISCAEGGQ